MGLDGFSGKTSNPLENQRETGIFAEEDFFFNSLFIRSLILHIVFTNSSNNLSTQPYSTQKISLTFTHPISTLLTSPPHPPPLTQQNKETNNDKKNAIKKLRKRG